MICNWQEGVTEHAPNDLSMKLGHNLKWTSLAQISKLCAQFVVVFMLARLLEPSEYGVVAMATVVVNFSLMFRDMGLGAAIIQKQDLGRGDIDAAFRVSLVAGGLVCLLVLLAAVPLATYFSTPGLAPLLAVLSLSFPIAGCGIVHQALLERAGHFRTIARIEGSSNLVGGALGLVSALAGAGAWSLVVQLAFVSIATSVQLWLASEWRPTASRGLGYRGLAEFGSGVLGFNLVNYLSRNLDSILVGRFYSSTVLGNYSLAYRLMLFPLQSITLVVSRSLLPVLSRLQSDRRGRVEVYQVAVGGITLVVAPMMVGLYVLREPFIRLAFGEGWDLAVQLLAWFAPTALLQSVMSVTGVVLMAARRTRTLLHLGVIGAVLQVGAFALGITHGVVVMAALYLLANLLNFIPVMLVCARVLVARPSEVIQPMIAPLIAALIMGGTLELYMRFGDCAQDAVSLTLAIMASAAWYVVLALAFSREWRRRALSALSVFRRATKAA